MINTQNKENILELILIILAGESVFFLPFVIQRVFRPTFLDVFELTNYELGVCFSIYGLVGLFSYFFGGALADKFSPRVLMSLALLLTSLGGLWMMNYPSYSVLKWLYGYWGFTSIFLFWGAMIKQTRIWGGSKNQGIAFGFLDGGRGLVAAVLSSVGILIFAHYLGGDADLILSERQEAFKGVLIFTSVFVGGIGILVFFFLDKNGEPDSSIDTSKVFVRRDFRKVMTMPSVWHLTVIVFCAYLGYKVTDIFSLYAKEVMLYDEIAAAGIGSILLYLRPIVGVIIGFLADRTRGSLLILLAFIMMFFGSIFFASGIINPSLNSLFLIGITLSATAIYALRALYFSILKEGLIPVTLTGTAVGVISFIAYTPDIFSGPIIGYLLDSAPGGAGYRVVFSLLAVFSLLGTVATWSFRKSMSSTHQQMPTFS